jgi:hypothetical protein
MFVNRLNKEQQAVLLDLTMQLIAVDGEFHEQEEMMLQAMKDQCNAGVESKSLPLQELGTLFGDQESKICLLLELVAIALADKVLHHSEKSLINDIASNLNIEDILPDAYQWVESLTKHLEKAEEWMSKNG